MYIRLFHGRKTEDEHMDAWGTEGPIIGPARISWAYGKPRIDLEQLLIVNDVIYFKGLYYGDFEILENDDDRVRVAEANGNLMSVAVFKEQLEKDGKLLPHANKPVQILLQIEGGNVETIVATQEVEITFVDFDVFEGLDPEPYDELTTKTNDILVTAQEFHQTYIRRKYDLAFGEYMKWKEGNQ